MTAALATPCTPGASGSRRAAAGAGAAPRAGRAVAEPIPVREWISVDHGQPARLLGFDQTLRLRRRRPARARPGDGLSALRWRCPTTRSSRATRTTYFLTRHLLFLAIAVVARAGRGAGADRSLGEARALDLRRRAAAARPRARPLHRQGRQRRAALDPAGLHELPAVGARQAGDRDVRRRLHGAAHGREGALLPRGRCRWRWRSPSSACCCSPSPTWAPSSSSR